MGGGGRDQRRPRLSAPSAGPLGRPPNDRDGIEAALLSGTAGPCISLGGSTGRNTSRGEEPWPGTTR